MTVGTIPDLVELLFEVPITDDALEPALVATSVELMYVKTFSDPEEEQTEVGFATIQRSANSIAAYAIKGHSPDLPIHAIATFESLEDFMKAIKPTKNGERTQLAVGGSIKIITGRFIGGEWTWTGA